MIGEKIRQARLAQRRSLADVAKKAKISVATLSRIETDKQTLDVELFLVLARLLEKAPVELLDTEESHEGNVDPVVRKIGTFEAGERAELWRSLAAAQRAKRSRGRGVQMSQLTQEVDELLAQIDFVREELEAVRRRLRKPAASSTR